MTGFRAPGVVSVSRNGKRRYDPIWKERLIAAALEPGVSIARLALEHGVNANQLRNWVKCFGTDRGWALEGCVGLWTVSFRSGG
jgi:transposase